MSSVPLEVRMGRLEGAYEQISKRLDSIDARLDNIDSRFDRVDAKFDGVNGKFDSLRGEVSMQFRWITGMIFGTWVTTILAIFFHR